MIADVRIISPDEDSALKPYLTVGCADPSTFVGSTWPSLHLSFSEELITFATLGEERFEVRTYLTSGPGGLRDAVELDVEDALLMNDSAIIEQVRESEKEIGKGHWFSLDEAFDEEENGGTETK